jgi:hypothetical protein
LSEVRGRINTGAKMAIVVRAWWSFVSVEVGRRRFPLPMLVQRLRGRSRADVPVIQPARLGHIVGRVVRLGPYRPRCLTLSLVLYRMLAEQGEQPELVIGLPRVARSKDAHAWVEVDGVDVGPPPGRGDHQELARYP